MKPSPKGVKVLAATLTWNEHKQTARCLDSLLKLDYAELEVALVDNGSSDGSYEILRERYPKVSFVRHRENFGYGEGVNSQIRRAFETGADYLFSVDNDAVVDPQTLKLMVGAAQQDPKTGIVFSRHAQGGFFLVRMEAVKKAGYLNPRYFIYYDDQEWFRRLLKVGYQQRLMPEVVFYHQGSSTVGRDSRAYHYYHTRNKFYFRQSYLPKVIFIVSTVCRMTALLGWELPAAWLSGRKEEFKGMAEGVFDFIRGKWGPKDFKRVTPPVWQRLWERFQGKKVKALSGGEIHVLNQNRSLRIQVNLDWNIGDEIMASPVFERLKQKYPDSNLDVLARFPALLENNPYVDSVNSGSAFQPHLFLNLHQEIRPRKRSDYLAEIAGVTGWSEPRIYLRNEEIQTAEKKWGLESREEFRVAICPEVWWLSRRWPRERWIELAERLKKEKKAHIFVLGKEDTQFPAGTNLVGKTGLRESAAVISRCDVFIGHDSGPLYMALAVGTPSVGLYGPLDPELLYPQTPRFTPVWTELECRGCWPDGRMIYRDHCPKIVPDCLTSISVDKVWDAIEKLMKQPAGVKRA